MSQARNARDFVSPGNKRQARRRSRACEQRLETDLYHKDNTVTNRNNTLANSYDLRRQARGGEPPKRQKSWRRKLIWISVALVCVAAVSLALWFLWAWCHVNTVSADVHAAVVELASHVDARLLARYVRPGQKVTKGQRLARLDDSQLAAIVAAAQAQRDIKQGLYAQAKANLDLVRSRVEADIKLAQARVQVAEAHVAGAEKALEQARVQLAEEVRRAEALYGQAKATLDRLEKGPRQEDIDAARARLAAARAMEELYSIEVRQSEQLVAEGIDSTHLLEVKKAQLTTQQNKVREAEIEVARLVAGATPEEIEAARQAVAARKAELALAAAGSKELESLTAQLDVRRRDVEQARAELACAEALRAEVAVAREQVEAAEAELVKADADVAAHRAALEGMSIVSPVTGTVIYARRKTGEICRKGEPFILVADDSAGRWVEGYVRERDAARVQPGQRAKVEIVVGSYHHVAGEVEAVGLATSSVSPANPGAFFRTPAHLGSEYVWVKIRLLEQRPEWRPGMTARARIRVH